MRKFLKVLAYCTGAGFLLVGVLATLTLPAAVLMLILGALAHMLSVSWLAIAFAPSYLIVLILTLFIPKS